MRAASALLRQWQLLRLLSSSKAVTVRELIARTGFSDKTIRRDLELLRRVGFPLAETVGERGRKDWILAAEAGQLSMQFTLEEAAALYLGRQFLEPLAGTYFFDGSRSAFAKLQTVLGQTALRYLQKLAAAFYHKSHGLSDYSRKGELIDHLQRAIEDRRLTAIEYRSLRSTEPVTHVNLHPYTFAWHKQALYLIGWSANHNEIRTFKVDRISAVETQQLQFRKPANFDAHEFLAGSFGIFHGNGRPQTVRVRFAASVVRILEERQFHSSQRHSRQGDGSLIATFELSSFEEFRSWVLSWGAQAEVLEPAALREEMAEIISNMHQIYGLHAISARSKAK